MSDTEEEWTTVRRRRGGRSGVTKQLKALAIPVVPLAFDALAEPEEQPAQDTTKAKKKKKGKKAKAAVAGDEDEEEDGKADAASGAPAAAGKGPAKTGAAKSTGGGSKAAQQSLFAWLLSRLVALLVMLGLMRATGTNKKKRKSKAAGATTTAGQKAAAATEEVKAPPATPAKVAADTAAAAPKAAAPVVPAASKQQQQQQQPAAKPAPAGGSATPAKKPAEVAPAKVVPAAAAAGKAASTAAATAPAPPAAAAAAVATPPPPATPEPKAAAAAAAAAAEGKPKPAEPPPAPATPAAPPPPAIKYDADWGRGKFVMQSLPTAHADVVAAVALAGDIAVSAGYDGAVKLWHWPTPGSQGGGVAPRLAVSRVLVGHSGRVEALAAHAGGRRLATSGRDSSLKIWDLGNEPGGSGAGELASTYVYESVRSLAADWTGDGGAAAGRVLLGARSGTVLLYSLGAGGAGRKVAALRGHQDEVTALQFLYGSAGGQVAVSGARDGAVRLWDLRTAGGAATAVLTGLSGRVCSLSPLGEHHLAAGDCSSTVKLWDLRQLPPSAPTRGSASPPPPPRRLPNAPGFAGSSCPTAGLWQGPRSGVLLSSCIAWWTSNKQALEEAPPNAKIPMACVNISAFGPPAAAAATTAADPSDLLCQYQYTLRLGLGVVTCLAGGADEGAVLAGGASGALWALRLVRGGSAAAAAAERAAAAAAEAMAAAAAGGDGAGGGGGSCEVVDALVVGAEEFSDDEYDDDDEEEEEDE
ncbi:SCF-dependent proteasomal ubiquitin-dependent protein catabolic process [Pleodorina starrii]|uniref:SCF-dependent proteasomal ubiquitin-dependent protein catabolic process n=1 Tax=Pleodorina starrii TaxID=330485 RepID=A0A9W6BK15_9CHLO|nr:SCF-dependent proteasomal ubiquitin-dependent protein catabolic process [Pleodorina starrii]GLC53273.1 SCF-dependent proteasomal ubiquitin-dependent protein catabolic process [Pleodorina starrii]